MSVVGINDAHSLCYYIAAKQAAGFPSPDEWNAYANLANIDLYNYYQDEREKQLVRVKTGTFIYMPPILSSFVVSATQITLTSGIGALPDDYDTYITLSKSADGTGNITRVDLDRLPEYLKSTIDPPTTDNPIYAEVSENIQVYPNTLTTAYLTYYQTPATVKWNYTMVNGRPQYTSSGSVDFQWDATELYRLVMRILQYMGISIRDGELLQYAEQMTQGAS